MSQFLDQYDLTNGDTRIIRTDQGVELGRSSFFRATAMKYKYIVEPTGSDAASENGMA